MEANHSFQRGPFFSKKIKCPTDVPSPSTQPGNVQDCTLGSLREMIKNAMIPLLIKVFEMKLAAQQAQTPPSRLQRHPQESLDKIREQLEALHQDLNLLQLWCESSQKQIVKALKETEEPHTASSLHTASSEHRSNPAIEKSFTDAFSSSVKEEECAHPPRPHMEKLPDANCSSADIESAPEFPKMKGWLRKFFS
jgi:hypothetical protein